MLLNPLRRPALLAAHDSAGAGAASVTLDAGALARLGELDPTGEARLLERVARAYIASADRLMPQFHAARQSGDWKRVHDVAHTFKSSSASIGALAFSQCCADVESMIRTQRTDGLDARLDAMCTELDLVLKAVSKLLGSGP